MTDPATPTLKPCPDAIEVTQADCDCMNAILSTIASAQNGALKNADHDHVADIIVEKITRHRLAAEATQAAENARLREAVLALRNGYADAAAGLAYVRQYHGKLSGVGFDRVADRFFEIVTMPEREGLLAGSHHLPALSAQPSEQDDGDFPEQVGTCENCRAIIRDGDNYIMDDYCVCLCSACAPSEQEGGE